MLLFVDQEKQIRGRIEHIRIFQSNFILRFVSSNNLLRHLVVCCTLYYTIFIHLIFTFFHSNPAIYVSCTFVSNDIGVIFTLN
jgi:hypothetical protein